MLSPGCAVVFRGAVVPAIDTAQQNCGCNLANLAFAYHRKAMESSRRPAGQKGYEGLSRSDAGPLALRSGLRLNNSCRSNCLGFCVFDQ